MAKPRRRTIDCDVFVDGSWVNVNGRTVEIALRSGFVLTSDVENCQLEIPPGWPSHMPRSAAEIINKVYIMVGLEAFTRRLAGILRMTLPV